ncbi:MAG: curli-like amyloid fiber formation chaperone CsgH [Maritimibacter sp.]
MNEFNCAIQKLKTSRGYDLTGVVWAEASAAGSYRLFVKKVGPSGRSSTAQEGLFSLTSDERRLLGTVSLNAEEGDRIIASLVIMANGQEVCTADL